MHMSMFCRYAAAHHAVCAGAPQHVQRSLTAILHTGYQLQTTCMHIAMRDEARVENLEAEAEPDCHGHLLSHPLNEP